MGGLIRFEESNNDASWGNLNSRVDSTVVKCPENDTHLITHMGLSVVGIGCRVGVSLVIDVGDTEHNIFGAAAHTRVQSRTIAHIVASVYVK